MRLHFRGEYWEKPGDIELQTYTLEERSRCRRYGTTLMEVGSGYLDMLKE
jgi:hypothetical protein